MPTYTFDAHLADTVFDSNVSLNGNLICDGAVFIDGRAIGNISSLGSVTVGVNSEVSGDINADAIIVLGKIKGNIEASGEVIIKETGMVIGDITSSNLTILPGGIFIGTSRIVSIRSQ